MINRIKLLALALLASSWLTSAQASSLTLTPLSQDVMLGNSFSVNLKFDAQNSNLGLGAYDFDVGYDASLINFQSILFSAGLDVLGLGSIQNSTTSLGSINISDISLDSVTDILNLQPNSFILATLNFQTLAIGTSNFVFTTNAIGDANGNAITTTILPSAVNVMGTVSDPNVPSAVPTPEANLMFIVGMMLLIGFVAINKHKHPIKVL